MGGGTSIRCCTFSRAIKEKGIEDAIEAIKIVNRGLDEPIASLDIYGQIDESYRVEFENICAIMPGYICCKGVVSPNSSVSTLAAYDILLFPTYYEGEGLAGTLIDAFAAGLAIIATDWHYNSEFVNNGQVGFLVDIKNPEMIAARINYICKHKDVLRKMKLQSSKEYSNYSKEVVIDQIIRLIK